LWDKASNFEIETNYPLQIEFELVNACNYKCIFCPYSFEEADMPKNFNLPKKEKIFDFQLFKKIIDEGSVSGLKSIELGYNTEPFLYKNLILAIEYAKSKGILDIRLSTNGSKLTRKASVAVIKAGLTNLNISLDAFSKETYQIMRQSNEYENVKKNILELLEVKKELNVIFPAVRISFVETEKNHHEKKDFIEFWKNKVDYISVQSLIKYKNTITDLSLKKIVKEINYNCHQPWTRVSIKSNGDIKPCCSVPGMEFNLPNANNISIKEFWNNTFSKKLRQDLKSGLGYKNQICKSCIESVNNKNN
jgi:radical SAM protein with 4Fe4S-binding SPASM domain